MLMACVHSPAAWQTFPREFPSRTRLFASVNVMAKLKIFDFLITAAALTALFLLLPADKDVKLMHKQQHNGLPALPTHPGNPKLDYRQPVATSQLRSV